MPEIFRFYLEYIAFTKIKNWLYDQIIISRVSSNVTKIFIKAKSTEGCLMSDTSKVNQVFCNPCFVIFYSLVHEYDHQKLAYIRRSLKGFITFYYQINLTEVYGGYVTLGGTSPNVFWTMLRVAFFYIFI